MNTFTRIRLAHERVRREYSPLVNALLISVAFVAGFVAHHIVAEVVRCLRRDSASFVAALALGIGGAFVLVLAGSGA